jgi:hypothetical protein
MRTKTTAILFAAILLALSSASAVAAPPMGEWHRLNPGGGVTDEHERLTCVEVRAHWMCRYDKLPEPGFHFDGVIGTFQGRNVTSSWECPDWFPAEICDNVVAVYSGTALYSRDGGGRFRVGQEYVITEMGGQAVLYQYWIDQFVCPWFRTFDEAVDANPTSEFDCIRPDAG